MKAKTAVIIDDLDFEKVGGLIPVVAQDVETSKVLTLAYANREALEKTIVTGFAHYFRRSFGKVLKKGETSGNVQKVYEILVDCDNDAILYLVKPSGPACHLGEESCFHKRLHQAERE